MEPPIRRAPSRAAVAVLLVAVIAVVAAVLFFTDGPGPPESPSPSGATATAGSPSASTTSPGATTTASPLPTDPPVGVARWTEVVPSTPGPGPRSGHSWTVDPSSAVAYLFGGLGVAAGALGDLWAYDLTADRWAQLRPDGEAPAPRLEHGAAWVDGLGLVVVGGRTGSAVLDDFWAYDPSANAWRTLDVVGARPSARASACVTLRSDGRLWLYGGERSDGTTLAELWTYDPAPSSWSQRALTDGPGGRAGSACWWSADDRFVVHGGLIADPPQTPVGDLWAFDPDAGADGAWEAVEAADLAARSRAAVTTTSQGGVVVGGIGEGDAPLADVIVFDAASLAANVLSPAPDGPVARSGSALADDPEGERTLLYGGRGASGPLADLWALDLP